MYYFTNYAKVRRKVLITMHAVYDIKLCVWHIYHEKYRSNEFPADSPVDSR